MPDISKINAVAVADIEKLDSILAANIEKVNGLTFATAPAFTGLLDTYTGAAAGYSTRKLKTGVTVAARLRRSGDNIEADVEFDSNNEISLTSPISNASSGTYTDLADFVDHATTPRDAFVKEWKDQSGSGNHATQTTPANQPKLYDATTGLITNSNGNTTVKFTRSNSTSLTTPAFDMYTNGWFCVSAAEKTGTVGDQKYVDSFGGTNDRTGIMFKHSGTGLTTSQWPLSGDPLAEVVTTITTNETYIWTSENTSSNLSLYVNGTSQGSDSITSQNDDANGFTIGARKGGTEGYSDTNSSEIIYWPINQSSNRAAIEENINSNFLIYQPTDAPTSGLLYDYGSATGGTDAAAAYSVRQLSDKAVICMRIRRDMGAGNPGDDDEINIGFDSNGDLDTQAIADFCGTGTGYVTRWWDQSTNGNHADQPVGGTGSNTSQPQIYNGTAVITENGKPTLSFPNQEYLDTGFNTSSTDFDLPQTMYLATRIVSPGSYQNFTFQIGGQASFSLGKFNMIANANDNTTSVQYRTGTAVTESVSSYTDTEMYLLGGYWQASTLKAAYNGAALSTGSSISEGDFSNNSLWIGGTGTTSNGEFNISEFLIWPIDQSSNKTGIETDIMTHFNIP